MRIGAQLRAGGQLVPAIERAREIGAEAVQVFTQSPRAWKPMQYTPAVLERYRAEQADEPDIAATYCHATYLVNLATPDPVLLERSLGCLVANLTVALGMGASGLVLHIGSHRGEGFEQCVPQVADTLLRAVDAATDPLGGDGADAGGGRDASQCPILLENAAGAGDTVGRTFEELASVLERAAAPEVLGICLDTQHLWASGVPFGTPDEADTVMSSIESTVGLAALGCLHLNDSKVPLGANRDRHANVGEGEIGEKGLGCLIAHPALAGRAAILEVPGEGQGPRSQDIAAARRALDAGAELWRDRAGAAAPTGFLPGRYPPNADVSTEEL